MMKNREGISRMGGRVIALAGLVVALGLGMHPTQAWAQVTCPPANSTDDYDGDGLTDQQECDGITLLGGPTPTIPPCGGIINRNDCVDPNTKDLFVIFAPAPGSLLPAKPFDPITVSGLPFSGLDALGITVHQISPSQADTDRTIVGSQKAVRISESLDTSGSILGFCNWGTPNGLDGCTVYTQRVLSFVASACGVKAVKLGRNNSSVPEVALAYSVRTVLHETGHTLGGLAATYNSKTGGYHYTAGTMMEQFATYSTKKTCTFNISNEWNLTLDPPAVKLK